VDITDNEALAACRDRALLLLSQRAHSIGELRFKLQRKQFAPPLVDRVLSDLAKAGLLDDLAYALAFCIERLRAPRPVGRWRILQELRKRRISDEIAVDAMAQAVEDDSFEDELPRALRAGEKKWHSLLSREPDGRKRYAKVNRFLASRGFDGQVCREVLDRLSSGSG